MSNDLPITNATTENAFWIAAVSAATARRCAAARLPKDAPVGRFVLREYCDAAINLLGSRIKSAKGKGELSLAIRGHGFGVGFPAGR